MLQKDYEENKELSGEFIRMFVDTYGPVSYTHLYLRLIHSAKDHVYLQTPYFIPDGSILDALKIAARSGVDVRIMIPCKPDHPFVYWATYSYIGEMVEACLLYTSSVLLHCT